MQTQNRKGGGTMRNKTKTPVKMFLAAFAAIVESIQAIVQSIQFIQFLQAIQFHRAIRGVILEIRKKVLPLQVKCNE